MPLFFGKHDDIFLDNNPYAIKHYMKIKSYSLLKAGFKVKKRKNIYTTFHNA